MKNGNKIIDITAAKNLSDIANCDLISACKFR